ncbi:MAG: glycosyltransferase family 39 protein [Burkholderiales bacterium]|nr:glycosyltransferase family 39 protein [Burkholderiales bacterium]
MSRRRSGLGAGVPLAAMALLAYWLWNLGGVPLFDVDEGAFAEASREMLDSGDWGHTTLNGADRFDKPILVYWLQATAMALFGANEWAVRLPSALCAWLWCLVVGRFAAERTAPSEGLWAAGLLACTLGAGLIGRAATADALLNLLLALAGLALWRFIEGGRRQDLLLTALWIGLGCLAKGPVALVVPGGAMLAWVAASRRWDMLLRLLGDIRAWLVWAAVTLPWYLYALHRHGSAFVEGFFLRHNVERFSGAMEGHGGALFYYLLVLPLVLAPWSLLLLVRLASEARALWADGGNRFLLCWLGFVLAFFSLSGTKLPHYALYAATPAVLLAAGATQRPWAPMVVAVPAVALVALGPLSPAIGRWLALQTGQAMVEMPAAPSSTLAWIWALMIVVLAGPWMHRATSPRTVAVALLGSAAFVWQALPWWAHWLQSPIRDLGQLAAGRDDRLVQWKGHQPSLAFYAGRAAPRRAPETGELALVRRDRLNEAERSTLTTVGERGPWLLARRQ